MSEPTLQEVNDNIDKLGKSHAEFKAANDARLKEIEDKGGASGLTEEKLKKIEEDLDKFSDLKTQLDETKVALNRVGTGGPSDGPDEAKVKADKEYGEHFRKFIKSGDVSGLVGMDPELKALSVGSDPDGGYLVTPEMSNTIAKLAFETTPMRQVASVISISSDSYEHAKEADEAASGGWVGEKSSRPATGTPTFSQINIPTHEQYANPEVTQKLVDDSRINIEQHIAEKVQAILTRTENTAFVSGDGNSKPRGILTYAAGTDESLSQIEQINSGAAAAVTGDGLVDLQDTLKEDYQPGASFMMKRATRTLIRQLKSTDNQYLWQPGLTAGTPESLLGQPLVMANDMPIVAASALAIVYGDFRRGYTIVDRLGIRVLRDELTNKPFIQFYTIKRVGGAVVLFEALKIQKIAA